MRIKCKLLKKDDLDRYYSAAGPQAVEDIYKHNHVFWTTRNTTDMSDECKKNIIDAQVSPKTPYNRCAHEKLLQIFAEESSKGSFSILEIGAANGTVMEVLKSKFPKPKLTYVGFECLPILAEDFRRKYPDQTIHVGTAEDFVSKEKSFFGPVPFTLFYAYAVFLMIKPDLVRAVLRKAAGLTDRFLIFDILDASGVELGSDETLVIAMPNRSVFWFVHPWEDYFAEIGFKYIEKKVARVTDEEAVSPLLDHQNQRGFGYVYAVRE